MAPSAPSTPTARPGASDRDFSAAPRWGFDVTRIKQTALALEYPEGADGVQGDPQTPGAPTSLPGAGTPATAGSGAGTAYDPAEAIILGDYFEGGPRALTFASSLRSALHARGRLHHSCYSLPLPLLCQRRPRG